MEPLDPVTIYEDVFVPALFGPCAQRLVERAMPEPNARVLDVACGTGVVARTIARAVGPSASITGLDATPAMLAHAEAVSERAGYRISWVAGRAEQLPFSDGTFDLVTCQAALMFFSDRHAAAAEMCRVLAPGGRAAIAVFQDLGQHPFYAALDDILHSRCGVSGVGDIFSFGSADALEALLRDAGFAPVSVSEETFVAVYPDAARFLELEIAIDTAVIPSLQHISADDRRHITDAIRSDIEPTFRRYVEGDSVVLSMRVNMAIGER